MVTLSSILNEYNNSNNVVYTGVNQTLDLIFTKTDSRFSKIPDPQPGDTFTIIIPIAVLATAGGSNLGSSDWKVQEFEQDASNFTFVLTPQAGNTVTWDANDQITIRLQGLEGGTASDGAINNSFVINNTPYSGDALDVTVSAPPGQPKILSPNYVAFALTCNQGDSSAPIDISPVDTQKVMGVPIANSLRFVMAFQQQGNLLSAPWSGKTPTFRLQFPTGTYPPDLTDAVKSDSELTSAWNIKVRISDQDSTLWKCSVDNSGDSPVWVITADDSNKYLFTTEGNNPNTTLTIEFDHIITVLPPGQTLLNIHWENIPGFYEGRASLPIQKAPPQPKILAFSGPGGTPDYSDPVSISWQTFGVCFIAFSWDGGRRSTKQLLAYDSNNPQFAYTGSIVTGGQSGFMLDSLSTEVTMTAYDANGDVINLMDENGNLIPLSATTVINLNPKTFPPPNFDKDNGFFEGSLALDGNNNPSFFDYSWLVHLLDNEGLLYIDGQVIAPQSAGQYNGFPGNTQVPITINANAPIPLDHVMEARQNNGIQRPQPSTQQITMEVPPALKPSIASFKANIQRDGNGNPTSVTLSWQVQNTVYSAALSQSNSTVFNVNGIAASIQDNNGSLYAQLPNNGPTINYDNNSLLWTVDLPFSDTGYTLIVSNPGVQESAQKTIVPQLQWNWPPQNLNANMPMAELISNPSLMVFNYGGNEALAWGASFISVMNLGGVYIQYTEDSRNWTTFPQKTLFFIGDNIKGMSLAYFKDAIYTTVLDGTSILVRYLDANQNWHDVSPPSQYALSSPSLAVFNGKLYLAYQGTDDKLYVTFYDGNSWGETNPYGQYTKTSPALAVFNGKLYCAFISNDQWNNLLLVTTPDGNNWNVGYTNQTSPVGPSLAAFGNNLYCAFICNDPRNTILVAQMDLQENWSPNLVVINNAINVGNRGVTPNLAVFKHRLYCAYWNGQNGGNVVIEMVHCDVATFG